MNDDTNNTTMPTWALVLFGAACVAGAGAAGYALARDSERRRAEDREANIHHSYKIELKELQYNGSKRYSDCRTELSRARSSEKGLAQRVRELQSQKQRARRGAPE